MGQAAWTWFLATVPTAAPWVLMALQYAMIRRHVRRILRRPPCCDASRVGCARRGDRLSDPRPPGTGRAERCAGTSAQDAATAPFRRNGFRRRRFLRHAGAVPLHGTRRHTPLPIATTRAIRQRSPSWCMAPPGTSGSMHAVARAIHARGWTVYCALHARPRSHRTRGRQRLHRPTRRRSRGFPERRASGGQTGAARFSPAAASSRASPAGSKARAFAAFVLVSPQPPARSPVMRPNAGGWVAVALPRIIALEILNRVGIHAFDGLTTLAFAVTPQNRDVQTATYSYRMMRNFGPSDDFAGDIARAPAPVTPDRRPRRRPLLCRQIRRLATRRAARPEADPRAADAPHGHDLEAGCARCGRRQRQWTTRLTDQLAVGIVGRPEYVEHPLEEVVGLEVQRRWLVAVDDETQIRRLGMAAVRFPKAAAAECRRRRAARPRAPAAT